MTATENSIDSIAEAYSVDCYNYIKRVSDDTIQPETYRAMRSMWVFKKLAELQLEINELKNK